MFPTTEQRTDRTHRNLDDLLFELSRPKEQINSGTQGFQSAPGTNNPDFEPGNPQPGMYPSEPGEQITEAEANLTGEMLANTIDLGCSTSLALYAKTGETEKYKAAIDDKAHLAKCWAEVAKEANFKISKAPWFNALFSTTAVYFPKFQEARNDRRFAIIDDKMEEMRKEIERTRTELESIRKEKTVETTK